MDRMAIVINKDERHVSDHEFQQNLNADVSFQLRSELESTKGDTFSDTVIKDCLHEAIDGSDLHSSMDGIHHYNILRSWSSQQQTNLLSQQVSATVIISS